MKIKHLLKLINLHLIQLNKQKVLKTGNDLVTELCPKTDFFGLFLSISLVF